MCEISVIVTQCEDERHTRSSILSILNQSFTDFEVIISDSVSSAEIISIAKTFNDKRICVQSESIVFKAVAGKYIAFMRADHLMHIDRLQIQHAFMEATPSVTVCASCVKQSDNPKLIQNARIIQTPAGLIENPLPVLLHGNFIKHTTAMIRKDFLSEHGIRYDIDDFSFWTEIAKHGGQFYVDTQTLMYQTNAYCSEVEKTQNHPPEAAINGIVDFLVAANKEKHPELVILLENFRKLQDKGLMTQQEIVYGFFHNFFVKNREHLNIIT